MLFEDTVWLTQKLIGELFGKSKKTISEHLSNIFKENELEQDSAVRNFRTTATDGKEYQTNFYNLDAIISIGYRVNSKKATQFRRWATSVLSEFAIKGYVLDNKRLENGSFLGKNYFDNLLEEIREIRLSERQLYQKVTDIYTTSVDYDKDSGTTNEFFAKVQNKLHFAIHGNTAAEVIYNRADSKKDKMGLTSWDRAPEGKILKNDVSTAKNYLSKDEIQTLGRIVNAYLELAEERALRNIPMTMEDWATRLDSFIEFTDRDVLNDAGKTSALEVKLHAESEFEKYRITQDRLFQSDFDKHIMKELKSKGSK
ncbi:MAG: virulence RhuM family protein [Fibrobacterales bacterium]